MTADRQPRQRVSTLGTEPRREAILKVAERLFFEQGYANTTIEQIVGELGVTKPVVYYYFRDKLEIFETISWRPTVDCLTVMDFAPDDERPAHVKLEAGLTWLIENMVRHYPAAFLYYREPQVFRPEYIAAQTKLARSFYAHMCALLEQGRRDGTLEFGEARLTALAAFSLPGFMHTWYRPDGRLPPAEVVREMVAIAMRVIGVHHPVARRVRPPSPRPTKRVSSRSQT